MQLDYLSPLDPGSDEKLILERYDLAFRTFSKHKVLKCNIPRDKVERDYARGGLCDKAVQFALDDSLASRKAQHLLAHMVIAVGMLLWVFPAALKPEDAVCAPLEDGSVDTNCIHGPIYRFYTFCLGISSMSFVVQLLLSHVFLSLLTRPYTKVDAATIMFKYGRRLDSFQIIFMYIGMLTLFTSLIICFSQRGTLLGVSGFVLVAITVGMVGTFHLRTHLRLLHFQGEKVRTFLDYYTDDVGILKKEFMEVRCRVRGAKQRSALYTPATRFTRR